MDLEARSAGHLPRRPNSDEDKALDASLYGGDQHLCAPAQGPGQAHLEAQQKEAQEIIAAVFTSAGV